MKTSHFIAILLTVSLLTFTGCSTSGGGADNGAAYRFSKAAPQRADDLLIVDCLLPGQVRKLGRMVYQTQRRPVSTTARDCEIRGGEYVLYDRAGYDEALNVWLPLANRGDEVAQTHVGEIYMKGLAGPPQYDMAAAWFQRAAERNYERAQMNLGYLYEMGLGVSPDPIKALNLYRAATGLEENIALESDTMGAAERQEMERLRKEVDRLQEETKNLRRRLEKTDRNRKKSLEKYQQQMHILETERKGLEKARKELSQLKIELEKQKTAPNFVEKEELAEIQRLREELVRREAELEKQRKRTSDLEERIVKLDERERIFQSRIEEKQQPPGLQNQLDKQRAETAQLRTQLDLAKLEQKDLREQLELRRRQLEARKEELAVTRRNLKKVWKSKEQNKESEISRLELELRKREKALEEEQKKAEKISSDMSALEQEVRKYQDKLQEMEALKARVELQESENQELRQLLEKTREEKKRLSEEFAWKQEHLDAERRGLKKARASINKFKTEIHSSRQARLVELEEEVSRREKEIEKQKEEAEFLRSRAKQLGEAVSEYQKKLENYEKKMENLAGPTIEILDPNLVVTRGRRPEARVKPDRDYIEIIGKVNSPAGLYALKVNDRDEAWNEEGLFKVRAPVNEYESPVNIMAIDNQGKVEQVIFIVKPEKSKLADAPPKVDFGRYYALIIGNNDYADFPKLQTAANDAREIETLLRDQYGFQTNLLLDATRFEIYTQLDYYRENLNEKDNFLLYYAGHGELDAKNHRGYWLPVDATAGSHVNSIPNYTITDILNNMSVRQAIVIADTCYSGSLTRSAVARQTAGMTTEKRIKWLKKIAEQKSRTVLSSGGLKPILDAGPGDHSIFAQALINVLMFNDDILEAARLYRQIRAEVAQSSKAMGLEQNPQYAANIHAGHEAGDFLFVPKKFQKNVALRFKDDPIILKFTAGAAPVMMEKGIFRANEFH